MINEVIKAAELRMQKNIEDFKTRLAKLRTGRAHTSLLESLKVSYYGTDTPITQVASIAVENAQTLTVTPWEKNLVSEIEKAIMNSELGLNPVSAGMIIRVPLPALTEERRRDLAKLVREEAEKTRVAIRNVRRDANNELKELLKDKAVSEDDARRAEQQVQKLTDDYIAQVDKIAGAKEKDLMEI